MVQKAGANRSGAARRSRPYVRAYGPLFGARAPSMRIW